MDGRSVGTAGGRPTKFPGRRRVLGPGMLDARRGPECQVPKAASAAAAFPRHHCRSHRRTGTEAPAAHGPCPSGRRPSTAASLSLVQTPGPGVSRELPGRGRRVKESGPTTVLGQAGPWLLPPRTWRVSRPHVRPHPAPGGAALRSCISTPAFHPCNTSPTGRGGDNLARWEVQAGAVDTDPPRVEAGLSCKVWMYNRVKRLSIGRTSNHQLLCNPVAM